MRQEFRGTSLHLLRNTLLADFKLCDTMTFSCVSVMYFDYIHLLLPFLSFTPIASLISLYWPRDTSCPVLLRKRKGTQTELTASGSPRMRDLGFLLLCVRKHYNHKQLVKWKGLLSLTRLRSRSIAEGSQYRSKNRAGVWRQELAQES